MAKKWIVGYEELYEVDELGTIYTHKTGKGASSNILTPQVGTKGYALVRLYDGNCVGKTFRVHRLVAEAFLPNPESMPEVNHKNRNKWDNRADNLEWCTTQQNVEHAVSKRYTLMHTDGTVVEIFNMSKWCREMGLHSSSMGRVLNGTRKTYRGWMNHAS